MDTFGLKIKRLSQPDKHQTLGNLFVLKNGVVIKQLKSLELPWLDNQARISCIPKGKYKVVKRYSPKYGNHFHVLDVPNRSFILIHVGNFMDQTLGCILVGLQHIDINMDGRKDVVSSSAAMKYLNDTMPNEFILEVE